MRLQHSPAETAHQLQQGLAFSSVLWGQTLFQMFLCQECELWRPTERGVVKNKTEQKKKEETHPQSPVFHLW